MTKPADTQPKQNTMDDALNIFLLIGQSNMAGRGRLDEVTELKHERAFMFRGERWVPAIEPLHADKPKMAGVGLGMSFAVELIEGAGLAPIGLVPCAVGGTPLSSWVPEADLYECAVTTTRVALSRGNLRGILWHQGEGDSGRRDDAETYGARFGEMIQSLRADLSAPSVPVIAGELGTFLERREGCEHFRLVNRQLRDLTQTLPDYTCVSSEGLHDNGDSLHFGAASLRQFGIRYARAFLQFTEIDDVEEKKQ